MPNIYRALSGLFKACERINLRAMKGLFRQGEGQLAARAVRSVNITIRGRRIAYEDMTEFDQAVVDEVLQCAIQYAHQYADHHDDYSDYRIDHRNSVEDVLLSHAEEIAAAGRRTLVSRLRSRGYDLVMARRQEMALLESDDLLKQVVMATIDEVGSHIDRSG